MRSRISTLLIVALLAVGTGAKAQDIHASGANRKANQDEAIDKVQYRITYRTQFVNDTTKRDSLGGYVYSDDDMRLDIGSTVSKFYSGRKVVFDKWVKDKIDRGEVDFTNSPARPARTMTIYRNYPTGETTFLDGAMMGNYRISEKTMTPEWTVGEDTSTILSYHCTKSETYFKGRHWTVWFTFDIPLDYGPWKLVGLPGLILQAEDNQKQYIFEATGLEQIGGKEDITLVKDHKKYELVSQKQFDKINRTVTANDALAASGITISMGNVSVKGMDEDDFMKKMKEVPPNNPIEIAE